MDKSLPYAASSGFDNQTLAGISAASGCQGPQLAKGALSLSNSNPPQGGYWRTASAYSITSSACSSTDCGIVSPIALAVFMLTTSSNLVGCSTGRSAGFAPLRILST
jgi:hypothetical protein